MSQIERTSPLRVASVGLGNWAGRVVDLILRHQLRPNPNVRLVSVFEPQPWLHAGKASDLQAAKVDLVESYESILNDPRVDAVILPVPIHLHRPMTESALAAGKPVLVEKPASGSIQDVDAMIAARDRAKLPVLVSFQDTYDPAIRQLKRLILDGEIGSIVSASLIGCWPRDDAYFRRCAWAGRLQFENTWVLDSPLSNAFAHYLHLIFYLLGNTENAWAVPDRVEAEMYRANKIENYDTASQRFCVGDISVLSLLTHACQTSIGPFVRIIGSSGTIKIDLDNRTATVTGKGNTQNIALAADSRECVLNDLARHLNGKPTGGSISTLEASRSHVLASNGASQCAMVRSIPATSVQSGLNADGERCHVIPGIERVFLDAVERKEMLHESRRFAWTAAPGRLDLKHYMSFSGCPSQSTFVEALSRAEPIEPKPRVELTK